MAQYRSQIGQPLCIPLPQGVQGCDVKIDPEPKLFSQMSSEGCGVKIQIYQPGEYRVVLDCGSDQGIEHQITVVDATESEQAAYFQVQPWVDMPPNWWVWGVQGLGLLVVCILGFLGMCWALKRLKKKGPLPVEVWSPEIFLNRLRKLEADYASSKLSPRDAAFELTSLLFEVSKSIPHPDMKRIFHHGYLESLEKWVGLKFNPDYSGNHSDIEKLIFRYTSELRKL